TTIDFLSVSRLDKGKGFEEALEAFIEAQNEISNIRWFIIGGGNEEKRIREIINRRKVKNVKLLGYKKNPYPYMRECDVFFHPSKYEGFGLVIAEAKILNKPILVTNFPGVNGQITNYETGLIVSFEKTDIKRGIVEISKDANLRK